MEFAGEQEPALAVEEKARRVVRELHGWDDIPGSAALSK